MNVAIAPCSCSRRRGRGSSAVRDGFGNQARNGRQDGAGRSRAGFRARCLQVLAMFVWYEMGANDAAAQVTFRRVGEAQIAVQLLGHSGPVIVFESGLGEDMGNWDRVAPPLSACARIVLYDRLGIGQSAPLPNTAPVLASTVADRLVELLRTIGTAPPYVLVGHSLGGLYVQSFARRHPQDVAAVVLIDPASPFEPPGVFVSTMPPPPGSTAAAEEAGVAPSVAAMLAGAPFPPVPLIVQAATNHGVAPEHEALWRDVQARTAALSSKGSLDIVEGSGHFIQKDRPEAVTRAVLDAARASGADVSGCARSNPVQ
jgi:pimeloyl-ACP methyl ester carboxylesterase